ncbi:MAG TPA: hypothetical protein VGE77_04955 [Nocardioides sp.]
MSLLRIDASIRHEGSASRELADRVEQEWSARNPGGDIVRRELGTAPLPADVTVVEREFTLVGVNPALDEFTDLAADLHGRALEHAGTAGRAL